MELIINLINGTFRTYAEVRSPNGYCFYDADIEEINYLNYIATPIVNKVELQRKFVLVEGDAEELNRALEEKRQKENS